MGRSPRRQWVWRCWAVGRRLLGVFFFFKIYLFIYLFLAVLGLRCCARALSSCSEREPLPIAVRGPLTIAASLVAERRLSSCGSRAQPLRGTRDPPRPGLEPASPASAGRLPTTAPPGKPLLGVLKAAKLVKAEGKDAAPLGPLSQGRSLQVGRGGSCVQAWGPLGGAGHGGPGL